MARRGVAQEYRTSPHAHDAIGHHPESTLSFLADLEAHNEKPWFEANKSRYQTAHGNMVDFADALLERMRVHDKLSTPSGAKSLMRVYTDQRFHKDKPPYAPRFGGRLARVKPALRGGYFYRIQPVIGRTSPVDSWGRNRTIFA